MNTVLLNTVHLNHISLNGVGERLRASAGGGGGEVIPPDVPVTYILSASASNGVVSASVNGNAVTLPYTANEGDVVIVEVTANDGYEFEGWADGNTDNPRTITMTADVTLSATCVEQVVESKYIQFEDPAVEAVLMANNVSSDGIGITKEDAAAVTSIGTWFKDNTSIVTFDEFKYFTGITVLHGANERGAFDKCSSLKKITLPPNLTEIQNQSFRYCSALESINLSNIAKIGQEAFVSTSSLNIDLNMPNLQSLGWSAFKNSGIKSIQNLGSITKLDGSNEYGTFYLCSQLESAVLPETLITISNQAFRGCSLLADINIPSSVTTISQEAFLGCSLLSFDYLNLPNLTSLGENAFKGVKIKKLNLGKLTSLPSATSTYQNYGDKSVLEEVVLPDTLVEIPGDSFHSYNHLHTINIPSTITKIGPLAFYGCTSLTSVDLSNVVTIDSQAFDLYNGRMSLAGNVNLTKCETIGNYSFRNCRSSLVDIGTAISSIGSDAFANNDTLDSILCRAITPPTLAATNAFSNTNECPIYVPDASLEAYKTATNWSTYASRIKGLSEYNG